MFGRGLHRHTKWWSGAYKGIQGGWKRPAQTYKKVGRDIPMHFAYKVVVRGIQRRGTENLEPRRQLSMSVVSGPPVGLVHDKKAF